MKKLQSEDPRVKILQDALDAAVSGILNDIVDVTITTSKGSAPFNDLNTSIEILRHRLEGAPNSEDLNLFYTLAKDIYKIKKHLGMS